MLFALLAFMAIGGCKKSEFFPIIPAIEFKDYYFTQDPDLPTDTLLGLIFSYTDGDGDIGLNQGDTFPPFKSQIGPNDVQLNPYFYNLKIEYLTQIEDGSFVPVIIPNRTDSLRYLARVQNITPDGKHKAIRGTIDWQILPPNYDGLSRTLKVRIQILDRALHESNIIESPVIELP